MRALLLVLGLLGGSTMWASHLAATDPDPVITVDKCREPAEPLGQFRATGVLRLPLAPDGRPDTTRIEVGSVTGLSAPGLRSVAARQLAACRFRIQPKPATEILVLQQFVIDSGAVNIRSIPAEGHAFAAIRWTLPDVPTDPLAAADTTLDEKPRQLKCNYKSNKPITTTTVHSQTDLESALREAERRGTGDVAFTFVVGPNGRVVPGSVALISSSNPSVTQEALAMSESCTYAPGRVAGVPVATRLDGRLKTRVIIGP